MPWQGSSENQKHVSPVHQSPGYAAQPRFSTSTLYHPSTRFAIVFPVFQSGISMCPGSQQGLAEALRSGPRVSAAMASTHQVHEAQITYFSLRD